MVKHIKNILKVVTLLFIITIFASNSMTIETGEHTENIHEEVPLLKELNAMNKYSTQEQNTDEGTLDEYVWYTSIEKAASDAITLKIDASQLGIIITSQPQDVTAEVGTTVTVGVVAKGIGLTYQWQLSDDKGATWRNSTSVNAVNSAMTFVMKETFQGRMMRCIITDASGNTVTSDAITLTIQ